MEEESLDMPVFQPLSGLPDFALLGIFSSIFSFQGLFHSKSQFLSSQYLQCAAVGARDTSVSKTGKEPCFRAPYILVRGDRQ